MMKLPIVDDWKDAGSWWSVRLAGVVALWGQLPAESQAKVMEFFNTNYPDLMTYIGLAFAVVRIYKQRKMVPADFAPTQRMDK